MLQYRISIPPRTRSCSKVVTENHIGLSVRHSDLRFQFSLFNRSPFLTWLLWVSNGIKLLHHYLAPAAQQTSLELNMITTHPRYLDSLILELWLERISRRKFKNWQLFTAKCEKIPKDELKYNKLTLGSHQDNKYGLPSYARICLPDVTDRQLHEYKANPACRIFQCVNENTLFSIR